MPVTFNTVCDRRPRRTAVEILFHVSDGRRMRNECITLVDGKYKIIITSSFSPSCHYHLISSGLLKWQLLSANSPQVFLVFPSFFFVCPVTRDACQFCCVQDQVLWALPPPNKVNDAVFIPPCTPNDDDSHWQGP